MGIQWTITAGFLYLEIFILILLTLPLLGARAWYWIFKMRVFYLFDSWRNITFGSLFLYLLIMFVDSGTSMMRAMTEKESAKFNAPGSEAVTNSKLFRAQRNLYISGFAILLALVIRRLVVLISTQAQLDTNIETLKKQARNAAEFQAAQEQNRTPDEDATQLRALLRQREGDLEQIRLELAHKNNEVEAMKRQAEGLAREYDRVAAEAQRLQTESESSGKKDD